MGDLDRLRTVVRTGAAVLDAEDVATLVVTGSERQKWLNGLVTCDLAPLAPGQGAYGLALAKSGKILCEVFVVLTEARIVVGVPRALAPTLVEHLDRHLIMEDAEVADASAEYGWLLAHGPRAPGLVGAARAHGADAAVMDMTGLGGAAVVVPRADHASAREALLAAAAPDAELAAGEAWEKIRIELGVPRFGVDFTAEHYPQEAALERLAVSFAKGCYLGQETVFMLEKRGHVKKKLVPLSIDGEGDAPPGAALALSDGTDVGVVTSRTPSPDGKSLRAIGFVKYKHLAPGTELVVSGRPVRVLGAE